MTMDETERDGTDTPKVVCDGCGDRVPHRWHWFDGCTCGAGGVGTDHRSHCALWGVELVRDDALIVAEL